MYEIATIGAIGDAAPCCAACASSTRMGDAGGDLEDIGRKLVPVLIGATIAGAIVYLVTRKR